MTRIAEKNGTAFDDIVEMYTSRFSDFKLDKMDIARMRFALRAVTGRSVLDVGVGHCILLNTLAREGGYEQLTAIDIRAHSQSIFEPGVDFRIDSIINDLSAYAQHDTVVCMEVIEHLEEPHNATMLRNLRALTSKRLVVTVPYDEPEPVWWHDKPGGHRQKFDDAKLAALFPTGLSCRVPRYGVDWVFIAEDRSLDQSGYEMVDRETFQARLADAV